MKIKNRIGKEIQLIHQIENGFVKSALFDFDGTISLIREGWQDVMIPMMVDVLMECPHHESQTEIESIVKGYVTRLTGRQTIYQMIQFCEEVKQRGGKPVDPLEYKYQYLDALSGQIRHRIEELASGISKPEDYMVHGSIEILKKLKHCNTALYLASGTDEKYVLQEAKLLGIDGFFDGIYGAQDDYINFCKRMVIEGIIQINKLQGKELVTFGDGYVEIEETKSAGGIAVGIASNETDRIGLDEWKKERLIEAGADIIVPDFREYELLIDYLFNK